MALPTSSSLCRWRRRYVQRAHLCGAVYPTTVQSYDKIQYVVLHFNIIYNNNSYKGKKKGPPASGPTRFNVSNLQHGGRVASTEAT